MEQIKNDKGIPIVPANAKELHAIEIIAALDCQLNDYEAHVKDRLQSVPDAWRQYRLARSGMKNAVESIYETLPIKTLIHMQRLCDHGEAIIRLKGATKTDDVQFVPTEGLKMLVNIAMQNECSICMKDERAQRKCKLRKQLMLMTPPDVINPRGCSYKDVAMSNDLGDYI